MPKCFLFTIAALLTFTAEFRSESVAEDEKKQQFFENKIRPVLIKHCYECHGSESKELKGGLRVDSRAALLEGGDSGASLVPGKPGESLLMEALRFDGLEMPPAGRLPDAVIADFEKWISDGAVDPRIKPQNSAAKPRTIDLVAGRNFWAFRPLKNPRVPKTESTWPINSIDQFILRRLEEKGLSPNPEVNKSQLIRRLYYDLTGLPPTPKDVNEFVSDSSPKAIERLVDRLLNSRQFGVHWGRHWLDVARYADSNGGDFNATFHNAWRYRDYCIDAFNDDKPFDLFVREQLAGDLMASENDDDRRQKIVATGFLMLGAKMLSERDKQKMTMDVVDEQINTVGQAFLGLTLGCARCHDHKFDPIPTRDYYALTGIFKSTRTLKGESQKYVSTWPRRDLPAKPEHLAAVKKFEANKKKLDEKLKAAKQRQSKINEQIKKIEQGDQFILIDDRDAKKIGYWKPSTISPKFVGKGYIHDDKSEKGEKWVEFSLPIEKSGKYEVQISYNHNSGRDRRVPVSIKHATGEKEVLIDQQRKPSVDGLFERLGVFVFDKKKKARVTVSTRGTELYVIVDAVRLIELDAKGKPIKQSTKSSAKKSQALASDAKAAQQQIESITAELKKLEGQKPKPLPKSIAVNEAEKIDDCQICIRGEHNNLGEKVPRGFLQVLTAPANGPASLVNKVEKNQSGRLHLARWITNQANPLTSRVFVNRAWHHLIGQGLVATVDNFGALGDRPSHPELLDHLATKFINSNWSTKKLIRSIVLSRTYRMSAQHHPQSHLLDPENRLIWRGNRKRLTAESIRDSMLVISGKLDVSPGGSPVEGLGTLVTQNTAEQTKFKPKDSLRRSIYLPMIRAELPEILVAFDIADPDLVTGRRSITNVPGQALLLLNSPFVMKQSKEIAIQLQSLHADPKAFQKQLESAYLSIYSRAATDKELDRGIEFLKRSWNEEQPVRALSRFIHTMLASAEYRMLE